MTLSQPPVELPSGHDLVRSSRSKLLVILTFAFVVRLLLLPYVPVNYDSGLYLYDASRLLRGAVPMVDFHSRSIGYHALLTIVLALPVDPLLGGRLTMILVSCATGAAVYVLSSELHSQRAGLYAAALFLFSPLTLVWGMWIKTEPVAVLGLLLVVTWIVRRPHWNSPALTICVGSFLGLVFHVRRVAVVHLAVVLALVAYYRVSQRRRVARVLGDATVIVGSMGATVLLGYALLVWPDVGQLPHLLREQFGGVFAATAGTATVRSGIGCPTCGLRLVRTIAEMVLVSLPAVLFLTVFSADALQTSPRVRRRRLEGLLIACIIGWGAVVYMGIAPYGLPRISLYAVTITVLSLIALHCIRSGDVASISAYEHSTVVASLPVVVIMGGYLVRGEMLEVTYYQDFFPFVAVLAGIAAAELTLSDRRKKILFVCCVGAALLGLFGGLYVAADHGGVERQYHLSGNPPVENVQAVGDDLAMRSEPSESVFSAQPLYAVLSDRRNAGDFSRQLWFIYRDEPSSAEIEHELATELASGRVSHVIVEQRTSRLLNESNALQSAVHENFCPAETTDDTYSRIDHQLYIRSQRAPECNRGYLM